MLQGSMLKKMLQILSGDSVVGDLDFDHDLECHSKVRVL